ncbi:hypothetical protein FHS46_000210 [Variibacter gotjawalensis]|nr:hypothetical protein [Variibacter gotjawalensis]
MFMQQASSAPGRSFFHRPRGSPDEPRVDAQRWQSLTFLSDSMTRADAKIARFFQRMDAGEAAVQAHQLTANRQAQPLRLPRSPRYLEDHLTALCIPKAAADKAPGAQPSGKRHRSPGFPAAQRGDAMRPDTNRCSAATNTRERLAQYERLCPKDTCNRYFAYLMIRSYLDHPDPPASRETVLPPELFVPPSERRRKNKAPSTTPDAATDTGNPR